MARSAGLGNEIAIPLTGRFSFRRSFTGKLVLRVEETVRSGWPWSKDEMRVRWRDATLMDLAAREMRALMDLRSRPQYGSQRYYEPADIAPAPEPLADLASPPPANGADKAWDATRSSH